VAKRFPFFAIDKDWGLESLFEFCELNKDKAQVFSDVLKEKDKVELNYKMMQLYSPNVSPQTAKIVKDTFDNFVPEFSHTEVIKKMITDGITDFSWETLFQIFRGIVAKTKQFKPTY